MLPFENLSDDKANAYLAEGIQDEVLTSLVQIKDLKVIGPLFGHELSVRGRTVTCARSASSSTSPTSSKEVCGASRIGCLSM